MHEQFLSTLVETIKQKTDNPNTVEEYLRRITQVLSANDDTFDDLLTKPRVGFRYWFALPDNPVTIQVELLKIENVRGLDLYYIELPNGNIETASKEELFLSKEECKNSDPLKIITSMYQNNPNPHFQKALKTSLGHIVTSFKDLNEKSSKFKIMDAGYIFHANGARIGVITKIIDIDNYIFRTKDYVLSSEEFHFLVDGNQIFSSIQSCRDAKEQFEVTNDQLVPRY